MTKELNNKIIELMFATSRIMREGMTFESDVVNLSILQIQAILLIKENPLLNMKAVADYFKIEMPTATILLNRLVKLGLVSRKIDKNDRRLVLIILTKKGEAVAEQIVKKRTEKMGKILSYLSVEKKKYLLEIMETLLQELEKKL